MGRRRKRSATANALYWLSGTAFIAEPIRLAAGGEARSKRAQRRLTQEQLRLAAAEQARAAQQAQAAQQQAAVAHQQAWAEWDRRNREHWAAVEAHRRAQPVTCRFCRNQIPAVSDRCDHCGAPREMSSR